MDVKITITIGEQYTTPMKVELSEAVPVIPKAVEVYGAPTPVADFQSARVIVARLVDDAHAKLLAQIQTAEDNAHALFEVQWDVFARNKPDEAANVQTQQARLRAQLRGDVDPTRPQVERAHVALDVDVAPDGAETDLHSVGSVARATDDDVMGDPAND